MTGAHAHRRAGWFWLASLSARNESVSPPLALMPMEYLTPTAEDRAVEVQLLLADRGQHRAPSIPDLLVAATAEVSDLTLLALGKDFELIAQVTGQPVEPLRIGCFGCYP